MKLTKRGEHVVVTLVVVVIGALLVAATIIGQDLKQARLDKANRGTIAPLSCYEDEPCWDCTTMGNGVCGP
jgi:hypothetical protein